MANKYPISLDSREMQTKLTIRYYLTPVRMAINEKITNAGETMENKRIHTTLLGK
jgi:hypothetical protein